VELMIVRADLMTVQEELQSEGALLSFVRAGTR
jgi:hypothetical protein